MAAEEPPKAVVQLDDVTVRFKQRGGVLSRRSVDVLAVDRVSFSVAPGRSLGLVGGTGSGKSTVAHVVMGMVKPTSGSGMVAGRRLGTIGVSERRGLRQHVQVVLQDPYSSLDPRMRVGDIIAEPLSSGSGAFGRSEAARARVAELLHLVGLAPGKADLYPHQFSGGQRQRIAIARALAPRPELIVLDEPTSALDVSVRAQILNLLKRLQEELGVTYIIISHDLITVAYLASTIAVMHLGRIVEIADTRTLHRSPRHPYTLELLASMPGATGEFLAQPRPATRVPSSVPPTACRFAYRCALRTRLGDPARCLEEDPLLREIAPGQRAACHFAESLAAT